MKLKLPEPGLVPMDAHGQNWSVTELEGGRLCLPERSARNNEVTELLVSGQVGAQIGSGLAGGEVYLTPAGQAENIAIKRFTATTRQGETGLQHGGLSELQAHHLLAVGLDMVKQADDTPWHFRGIRVHGGLLYPNGDGPDRATAVWAMERVLPASAETDTACSWENYLSSKRGRLARMAATYLDLSQLESSFIGGQLMLREVILRLLSILISIATYLWSDRPRLIAKQEQ